MAKCKTRKGKKGGKKKMLIVTPNILREVFSFPF